MNRRPKAKSKIADSGVLSGRTNYTLMPHHRTNQVFLMIPLVFLLLSQGCASVERFRGIMDSHMGQPISRAQESFGYNHGMRALDDGRRAYTWVWTESEVSPGYETPTTVYRSSSTDADRVTIIPGQYFPPERHEVACEFTFITGPTDTVVAWRAHGNGCGYFVGPSTILTNSTGPR